MSTVRSGSFWVAVLCVVACERQEVAFDTSYGVINSQGVFDVLVHLAGHTQAASVVERVLQIPTCRVH